MSYGPICSRCSRSQKQPPSAAGEGAVTDIEAAGIATTATEDDLAPARGIFHGLLIELPFLALVGALIWWALQ